MARILVVGGTGFIGRHIASRLTDAGHTVFAASHSDVDLVSDDETKLVEKVANYQVVINCAGLVRNDGVNTMKSVHADGACALFRASITAGVKRLIHISALGVEPTGDTVYQQTKAIAEEFLIDLDPSGEKIDWRILRPSLVVGRGGASTRWLLSAAVLPRLPSFGDGRAHLQPVHVMDLVELVLRLAEGVASPRCLNVVGPDQMTINELLAVLREWLGLPATTFIQIPNRLFLIAASIGGYLSSGPLNREIVKLLSRDNVGDVGPMTAALGRQPRSLGMALALTPAYDADRLAARLFFLRPALRWSLALLWVSTGVLSLGLYPIKNSHIMLAEIGLHGPLADLALYGGAVADLLLGLLLIINWRPVIVGGAQLILMTLFTIIAFRLPAEYWLHPFAPLLKNLPIAMALLVMMAMES